MELGPFHNWKQAPQWFSEKGSILFSHGDSRSFYQDLYEVSIDGSRLRVIQGIKQDGPNDLREAHAAASISPDLSRLTYADFEHDAWFLPWSHDYDWEIVTSDPDGSNKERITDQEGLDYSPVWSPDGSRIAFLSSRLGQHNIFSMSPDGKDVRSIAPSVDGVYSPLVWSPDSRRIAFALKTMDEPYWVVYVVDLESSSVSKLDATVSMPAWSADSMSVAFLKPNWSKVSLYTARADGSELRKVHELEKEFTGEHVNVTNNLAWSPDGRKILLSGKGRVAVVEVDSSEFRLLLDRPGGTTPLFYSSWSPDGAKIAVGGATSSTDVANGFDAVLFAMDSNGANKRVLARYTLDAHRTNKRVEPAHSHPWPEEFGRSLRESIPGSPDQVPVKASVSDLAQSVLTHDESQPTTNLPHNDVVVPELAPLPTATALNFEVMPFATSSNKEKNWNDPLPGN